MQMQIAIRSSGAPRFPAVLDLTTEKNKKKKNTIKTILLKQKTYTKKMVYIMCCCFLMENDCVFVYVSVLFCLNALFVLVCFLRSLQLDILHTPMSVVGSPWCFFAIGWTAWPIYFEPCWRCRPWSCYCRLKPFRHVARPWMEPKVPCSSAFAASRRRSSPGCSLLANSRDLVSLVVMFAASSFVC